MTHGLMEMTCLLAKEDSNLRLQSVTGIQYGAMSAGTISQWPRRFAKAASVFVLLVAGIIFCGWMFHVTVLKSVVSGWPKMAPLTALDFLLAGTALCLCICNSNLFHFLGDKRERILQLLSRSIAALVVIIGLIRLGDHIWKWNLGLDTLGFHELLSGNATPAQMSPATAFDFVLLGCALLLACSSRFIHVFEILCLVGGLMGWLSLSRYIYGGEPLLPFAQMALHTSAVFFILSAGVLCARSDGGLMALLISESAGGIIFRRLLPPALILPVVIGWLRLQAQRAGWFGTEAGLSLFTISNVAVFGLLVWINAKNLHRSDQKRRRAEEKNRVQLERLNLLHQITRAIGERQDLHSIFQVVIRSLEDNLPIDFGSICLHDRVDNSLTVVGVGVKSHPLALEIAMPEQARIPIDQNGLSRCVRGELVYEPDIVQTKFPFPQRLAQGGLRSLVIAPLMVESEVLGVLVAARREAYSFNSTDCEFLKQLSEHVALAAHQSQLHEALRQAYDDLHATQQAVMQQERLRALGQMASGIAHDINNAVSPVALYSSALLEQEPNLSPRARNYLETISHAIDDVTATVSRMREFYRQREPELKLVPLPLNELVVQVLDLTRARWSDMPQQSGIFIEMITELATELPSIRGVESEIREALTNLVLNAVDAMPKGGTITLRTRLASDKTANNSQPHYVCLEVIDTGIGMDEDTRRRCLEPFYTTKGERGTGLGLAMVYGIIRRHNADIEIESIVGEGTTIRLVFNVPTEVTAHSEEGVISPAMPSRQRILIVDDDPILIKSLRNTLESDGHVVVAANGGQDGIDVFATTQKTSEPFTVVITDLGMPHVDGRKVASSVKSISPTTPIIMLTGWGQRLVEKGEVPPHVDRVLNKPPKLQDLRAALWHCCQTEKLDA